MTGSERRTAFWPRFLLMFRNHITSVAADGKKLYIIFGWPCSPPLLSTVFSASLASSSPSLSRPLKLHPVCCLPDPCECSIRLRIYCPRVEISFHSTVQIRQPAHPPATLWHKNNTFYSFVQAHRLGQRSQTECSPCCCSSTCTLWRSWPAIGQWPHQESPTAPVGSLTVFPTPSAGSEEIYEINRQRIHLIGFQALSERGLLFLETFSRALSQMDTWVYSSVQYVGNVPPGVSR